MDLPGWPLLSVVVAIHVIADVLIAVGALSFYIDRRWRRALVGLFIVAIKIG